MRTFIVLALFVAAAVAAPADSKDATILRYENTNIGTPEGYSYAYETSDGKKQEEVGSLKNVGTENEANQVRGQFSFTAPDGVTYTVTYTADETGFHPVGAHLPTV